MGENGILKKANQASTIYNKQQAAEEVNFKILDKNMLAKKNKIDSNVYDYILENLKMDNEIEYIDSVSRVVKDEASNNNIYLKLGKYNYEFEINENFEIVNIREIENSQKGVYKKITYNFNVSDEIIIDGKLPDAQYALANDSVEIDKSNNYKRDDGYMFVGWGEKQTDKKGLSELIMPEEDITLYAIWTDDFLDCIENNPNLEDIVTVTINGNGTHRYDGTNFGTSISTYGKGTSNTGDICYKINMEQMQNINEEYKIKGLSADVNWSRSTYTKPNGTEYWNYGAYAQETAKLSVIYDDDTTEEIVETNSTPTTISAGLVKSKSTTIKINNESNKKIKEITIIMSAYCTGRTDEYNNKMTVSSTMLCSRLYFMDTQ